MFCSRGAQVLFCSSFNICKKKRKRKLNICLSFYLHPGHLRLSSLVWVIGVNYGWLKRMPQFSVFYWNWSLSFHFKTVLYFVLLCYIKSQSNTRRFVLVGSFRILKDNLGRLLHVLHLSKPFNNHTTAVRTTYGFASLQLVVSVLLFLSLWESAAKYPPSVQTADIRL